MNVHISYKAGKTPDVEREFQHQLEKIERRLQVFKPELVHFHAILEAENGHSIKATLNLRLPSGQMAAQKSGETIQAAIRSSFADLVSQLNKHKELLRGNWRWKRRRGQSKMQGALEAPFEQALAPTLPEVHSAELHSEAHSTEASPKDNGENGDVGRWMYANLSQLEEFIDRELQYRVDTGQIRAGQVSREEVIDEVMVSVLSGDDEKSAGLLSDNVLHDSRLNKLALRALQRLVKANADIAAVSLDAPAGVPNVTGSDENVLQYHQPDDTLEEESIIRDQNVRTPEEIFAGGEMVAQLDIVLRGVGPREREAFVLYALEGFTMEEISRITDLPSDTIRQFIRITRDRIQRSLPAENELRQTLLHHSRVA